jgi:hypothetical protein
MTPQEAQIIRDVFAKIRMMGSGSEDREAIRAVEAELAANPAAALGLVKVVVGLERERDALEQQARELAAEVEDLQARAHPQSGGLFGGPAPRSGGLFGGSAQPAQSGPWGTPQASGPWGAPTQPQSGGFWGSALRTGAGVAGGLFAFEALKGLFGGGTGGSGHETASGLFDGGATAAENATHFEGDRSAGNAGGGGFGGEAPSREAFVADDIDFTGGFDDDGFA